MREKCKSILAKIISVFAILSIIGFPSCSFLNSFDDSPSSNTIEINSLSFAKTSLQTQVGGMEYISVAVKPSKEQKNISLKWDYDKSIIECDSSSNWGVTIKGLAEGKTTLRCSYGGYEATCLVAVEGVAENYEVTTEPYIYSNYSVLQTSPGVSEKVFVSLYGGDVSDIDGYTWTVDNPAVASIQPTGQYCIITAKDAGYARIKITHTKAAYPYYMGVYVFADATEVSYITTSNNIITMNQDDGDKAISVSLVNGKDGSLDSQFAWEIINEKDEESPISLSCNENNAVISPKHGGNCTLRVTHPDSAYPLDILCRVISIVKNVYIQPSTSVITLTGEAEQTITSELVNLNAGEYNIDGFKYILDDYNVAEIVGFVGNQVTLKGLANGSCKLIISHEKSEYSREVLVIANGQLKDAVDASCYITTSQNYIRTKVGAAGQTINISLKGGVDGDESLFMWSVKSTASDGSTGKVINLETTNGSVFHTSSRAAAATYSYGSAYLEPFAEGTAVITITHPKVLYPTEILLKVLNKDAILEEPLYFTGEGLIRILNGQSKDYTVQLRGNNKNLSDDSGISWSIDDSRLSATGNGNIATVKAPAHGSGSTISHLNAHHNKADSDKTVLVMTADDEETLMNMKALYADKLYYNFTVGNEVTVVCSHAGFENEGASEENYVEYDFSQFKWTISDPSVISIQKNDYPLSCTVKGLKSGKSKLTGSIIDNGTTYSCEFTMTVYPEGAVQTEPEIYFTTTQNVVTLGGAGNSAKVSVTAISLPSSEYSNISWKSENENVATVISNGTSATITAVSEGESVIKVTHPDSQNTIKIYVRVGSEYVIPEVEPVVYISSQDVLTMLRDDSSQKLQATLVNYSGSNTGGFSFSIDNDSVAQIYAQSEDGVAYIKPVSSGQAEITITHTKTDISKKVLVVVGNSAEELAGYTYLTTSNNVVAIGEGNTRTVTVSVKNSDTVIVDGYTWTSSNPAIVDVTSSGATAMFKGNKIGTAIITVTNKSCTYSLQIIAQVIDPIAASANPYIQLTSSVMTLTCGTSYTSITAELVGGSESDKSDFIWQSNDSKIAVVYGQNEVGKVRALATGTTYITVSHPKAAYSAQILVVCDEEKKSDCYITVPSSIVTMKPTDSAQTITATLVNGAATDKYNFSWSLDVYDIIDFQYSANVCTITPKQTGSVTITITHPKAAYNQQVIVNVQQYSTFAFPQQNMTITQGEVSFISMQVPNTNVATHIEYSVENSNICSVKGTKTTAQITAVGAGTTTVKARLIASSSGAEQASAEMMVYVKEKEVNAVYITASSTVTTLKKGKSQTLSASLTGTGVVSSDVYNLKWTTSDSDIVQVTGIGSDGSVIGQSIYITALKPGEAVITCSHPKAASTLQFYVVVPGSSEKLITLNKTYITLVKGSSGTPLKASIENSESQRDYYDIIWTAEEVNGSEICRIMGNGQNVTVYPIKPGQTTVTAQLPDSDVVAKCTVIVEAGKSFVFETSVRSIQPKHTVTVKYTVSPPDTVLTWTTAQTEDFFEYHDNGCDANGNGSVDIIGNDKNKIGSGTLTCISSEGAKGMLNIKVAWDYDFSIKGVTAFSITPDEKRTFEYSVNPADADIIVVSSELNTTFGYEKKDNGDGSGTITIKPFHENQRETTIDIIATNPKNNDEEIGRKTIKARFVYKSVDPKIQFLSSDGRWTNWSGENNLLSMGDGETARLKVYIDNEKADASITKVEFVPQSANGKSMTLSQESSGASEKVVRLSHPTDSIVYNYRIDKLLVPYIGGKEINWMSNITWRADYWSHSHTFSSTTYDDFIMLCTKSGYNRGSQPTGFNQNDPEGPSNGIYGYFMDDNGTSFSLTGNWEVKEDESWIGRILTQEELKNYAWLYFPGTPVGYKNTFDFTYNDIATGAISRGSYGKGALVDSMDGRIMTENVSVSTVPSTDTTVQSGSGFVGYLVVYVRHNGSDKDTKVYVNLDIRNCEKGYR